jgi:hypothetical protein
MPLTKTLKRRKNKMVISAIGRIAAKAAMKKNIRR